jgi:hypothetical protein
MDAPAAGLLTPDGKYRWDGTRFVSITPSIITQATDWAKARAGETSTLVGAGVGLAASPTLLQYAATAITAGLAGDYVTCAQNAIPFLAGVGMALYGIIKPDPKSQGPTDDQIHAALYRLPDDALRQLLTRSIIKADQPAGGARPTDRSTQ